MNKTTILFLVFILAIIVVGVVFAQNVPNVRWEYHTEEINYYTNEGRQRINALGSQGWELVGGGADWYVFFKRRLP